MSSVERHRMDGWPFKQIGHEGVGIVRHLRRKHHPCFKQNWCADESFMLGDQSNKGPFLGFGTGDGYQS